MIFTGERSEPPAGSQQPARVAVRAPKCAHLGKAIDRMKSWPCSCDKNVYECAIYGKAVKRAARPELLPLLIQTGHGVCDGCPRMCES